MKGSYSTNIAKHDDDLPFPANRTATTKTTTMTTTKNHDDNITVVTDKVTTTVRNEKNVL